MAERLAKYPNQEHYNADEPCKKCKTTLRVVKDNRCVQCHEVQKGVYRAQVQERCDAEDARLRELGHDPKDYRVTWNRLKPEGKMILGEHLTLAELRVAQKRGDGGR